MPSTRMGSEGASAEKGSDLLELVPCVQQDAWGMTTPRSLASRLASQNSGVEVMRGAVCSAIAVGTHPSSHTMLKPSSSAFTNAASLLDYIRSEVIEVDSSKVEHYARLHRHGLPFILRVISVNSSQGIHVHPDGLESVRLHEKNPDVFPDTVGRAEMAVALTPVDALFGFRAMSKIVAELARVPEFADAVGRPATDAFVRSVKSTAAGGTVSADALKLLFHSFMNTRPEYTKECLDAAVDRFNRMPLGSLSADDDLFLKMAKKFPNDPMCFSVYFFNRVRLNPGEAVFIHPKEPHSYLSGDLAEVSSSSSNTAWAGLSSSKNTTLDKEEFLNLLNYDDSPVEISVGEKRGDFTTEFIPPVDEFMLTKHDLPSGKELRLAIAMAPSILAIVSGEGFLSILEENVVDGSNSNSSSNSSIGNGTDNSSANGNNSSNSSEQGRKLHPLRVGSIYYLRAGTPFLLTSTGIADSQLVALRVGINESSAPEGSCVIS